MHTNYGGQLNDEEDAHNMKNRIRVLRAERRWTQAELGEKIGVSRNSVNAIENNKHEPSLPLAFRIANQFGLPVEQVFENEYQLESE